MADTLFDTLDPDRLKKPTAIPRPDEQEDAGLAPKIGITENQPSLASFGGESTPPRSILGDKVKPGEPISDKQMPEAQGAFHQTDPYHGMLKSFGDQKAALDHLMPTNVRDPNYLQDLNSYRAARNAIKENEVEFKKAHPWGSVDPETGVANHPGFFGKLGHVLGTIGNVAGEALAPGLTAAIPGSKLNLEEQSKEAAGGIKEAETEQAGIQKAQAALDTSAAKQQHEDVYGATKPKEVDIQDRLATTKENTIPNQIGGVALDSITNDPNLTPEQKIQKLTDLMKQEKAAQKPMGQQHVAGMLNGKPAFASYNPDPTATEKFTNPDTGAPMPGFVPNPQQPSAGTLLVAPQEGGGGKIVQAKPGMTLTPGTQNISGYASLERPTTQMRNIDEQAKIASQGIPNVVSEIQRLGPSLGPVAGRWNDFMQGKVGSENPDFAGLRADLLMVSSAVALAHARGRLPENLREEFDRMINAPSQTPENLIKVLDHIKPWMDRMSQMGPQNPFEPGATTNAPSAPANTADPFGILGK